MAMEKWCQWTNNLRWQLPVIESVNTRKIIVIILLFYINGCHLYGGNSTVLSVFVPTLNVVRVEQSKIIYAFAFVKQD